MSDKKSKSKSKEKEKPPKDTKSKKPKEEKGDAKSVKSKKSADKGSKGQRKSSKKQDGDKSKISKPDMNESQEMSFFKPLLFQQPIITDESLCQYHNQRNTVFCEICQQVGCQQCLVYGPHNNQMHRISKIDQAFRARYLYLNQVVCGQLVQRRDTLNTHLDQLTLQCDELRYFKNGVQKTTKMEFNEMMDRLRVSSGGKFAILHHQMAELQKDLEAINALGNQFFELTNMNPQSSQTPQTSPNKGMVPFLLRTKYLQEQAEQLISKPIKTSVDVYPYDLPRQLTQRKAVLDKNKCWTDLLNVKDQCIWNLLEQKKFVGQKLWKSFYKEAAQQIEEWEKLKQKVQQQIEEFRMVCKKCHTKLDSGTVNQDCPDDGDSHFFQK